MDPKEKMDGLPNEGSTPAKDGNPTGSSHSREASGKRKGSHKRGYHKPREDGKKDSRKSENDISWYVKDKALLESSCRLSFNTPLGNDQDLTSRDPFIGATYTDGSITESFQAVPGIMALKVLPTFGISRDANSPLNVAARNMFAFMRSALSSNLAGIEMADFMVYAMCMDSAYSYYGFLARLYGIICEQNALNRYYGRGFVTACGVDYGDALVNLPKLRFFLRTYKKKLETGLRVPSQLGSMRRHYWLYSNIFRDSPVEKSQSYIHVPTGFYVWNPTKYNTGSCAEFKPYNAEGVYTIDTLIAYGLNIINPLLMDDDVANMSGLILRAFGTEGLLSVPEIPEDYVVQPVYNEEILGQIHNARLLGFNTNDITTELKTGSTLDYQQRAGSGNQDMFLYYQPTFYHSDTSDNDAFYSSGVILRPTMDSFSDVPTCEEVMINSRNIFSVDTSSFVHFVTRDEGDGPFMQGTVEVKLQECGLDIITGVNVYVANFSNASTPFERVKFFNAVTPFGVTDKYQCARQLAIWSMFDWAPRLMAFGVNFVHDAVTNSTPFPVWDYNNAVVLTNESLQKMHEAAMLGAFDLSVRVSPYSSVRGAKRAGD